MTATPDLARPGPDVRALLGPTAPSVLIETGADAGFTFALAGTPATGSGKRSEPLMLRVATTPSAWAAIEHETRMLVELRRRRLGPVESTLPRYVATRYLDGHPAVVSSSLPGRSMAVGCHRWMHTARPELVRRDFRLAGSWLARFQDASFAPSVATTWGAEVGAALERRWCGHPELADALVRVARATRGIDGVVLEQCVVHGDFTADNVLVDEAADDGRGAVSGVLNWTRGELAGSPLRDLGCFAAAYSAGLDHATRPGHRVLGHPGLRRTGPAPGLRHTLLGHGWYARVVREYLTAGLTRLGLPAARAGDVLVLAIAEIAATSHDPHSAEDHLAVLAELPE